jgi:catechol 2,3-dioxygenase-like lactoylglutathione lyase family enzyme
MPATIPVPDVKATAEWYAAHGFAVAGGEAGQARIALGRGEVTFLPGEAGEVDLYISVLDVEALHARLNGLVELAADLHDTEFGMRQFAIRDLNGFLITFGQPIAGRREPAL